MREEKLIIIGSGPAGLTAGIYAGRANLSPIIITGNELGGVTATLKHIENYPGFPQGISGKELIENMVTQAKNFGAILVKDTVTDFEIDNEYKIIKCQNNTFKTKALIIATGIKKISIIKNQSELLGFGVSTCVTCDAFFYKNKPVGIYSKNQSNLFESIDYLNDFANKIFAISPLKLDENLKEKYKSNEKIKFLENTKITEIIGDKKEKGVTGIKILNSNGDNEIIKLDGIFLLSNEEKTIQNIFSNILNFSDDRLIISQDNSCKTNIEGIFVAGDISKNTTKQIVCAVSDGANSAIEAKKYLMLSKSS